MPRQKKILDVAFPYNFIIIALGSKGREAYKFKDIT